MARYLPAADGRRARASRAPAAAAPAAETLLETDSCIKAALRQTKAATPGSGG